MSQRTQPGRALRRHPACQPLWAASGRQGSAVSLVDSGGSSLSLDTTAACAGRNALV